MSLDYGADYIVRFEAPRKQVPGGDANLVLGDLLTDVNGATCSFAVYSVVTRAVIVSVSGGSPPYDVFEVSPEDAAILQAKADEVSGYELALVGSDAIESINAFVNVVGTTLTIAPGVTTAPIVGTPIRRIFGPVVNKRQTMIEFGEASIDPLTYDLWGWRGGFTNTLYADIPPGEKFEIESVAVGAGGDTDGVRRKFHVMRDTRSPL